MITKKENPHASAINKPVKGFYPRSFGRPCFDEDGLMPIMRPFASLFAERCITEDLEEILPYGNLYGYDYARAPHFGHLILDLRPANKKRITRYLWALLRKVENDHAWECFEHDAEVNAECVFATPIRFSVIKQCWGGADTVVVQHYLVAECFDEEFDRDAAERQVGLLVAFLSDEANVPEITEEQCSMLL